MKHILQLALIAYALGVVGPAVASDEAQQSDEVERYARLYTAGFRKTIGKRERDLVRVPGERRRYAPTVIRSMSREPA